MLSETKIKNFAENNDLNWKAESYIVWFECPRGHTFSVSRASQKLKSGCPTCNCSSKIYKDALEVCEELTKGRWQVYKRRSWISYIWNTETNCRLSVKFSKPFEKQISTDIVVQNRPYRNFMTRDQYLFWLRSEIKLQLAEWLAARPEFASMQKQVREYSIPVEKNMAAQWREHREAKHLMKEFSNSKIFNRYAREFDKTQSVFSV